MKTRKAIKSLLHNFLETYTSRYSDFDGFWLFGMLVGDLDQLSIDLLDPRRAASLSEPMATAINLATSKFQEQAIKAGIDLSAIQEAYLEIRRSAKPRDGEVNHHPCVGYDMQFTVTAISDRKKTYQYKTSVFVAPHNPQVELRSTPQLTNRDRLAPCPRWRRTGIRPSG